ncbi:MAG: MFS transporter [Candidatus Pacebacteria bacterium]|nr:MFS transporter [Candidatus Paceibacterota bacterium]
MERFVVVARRYLFMQSSSMAFVKLFVTKRLIHGAATALLGVFVPIFLYVTTGENFYVVGTFFAVVSLAYFLVLVPAAQIMNRFGTRVSLVIAGIFNVSFYVILYFADETNIWMLLGPLSGALLLLRLFHWVPYHVDFATFTKDGQRGKSVGLTYATIAFMGIIGPILAGYIIKNSGYDVLFAISVILLGAAAVSYAFVPKTHEKFTWTYGETLRRMWSPEYRPMVYGSFANGLEIPITLIAWPIFLYEILDGNVFEIGAVSTLVTAITILLQLVLGKYLDGAKSAKQKTLRVGSTLYAIGWIIKIFVLSAAQVFFVGLYHNITKVFTKTPFDTILYDMSADQGRYVDEFTVMREMSNHLGRAVSLALIVLMTLFIPLKWTFVIGAGAALLLNVVYKAIHD